MLDLGTGSGAVLCALLHDLPRARAVGVDRSFAACRIARHNVGALRLGHRATIVCGSWRDAIGGRFDAIACNPPYIRHGDMADLPVEVAAFDPVSALDGGLDGFAAYRAIIPGLRGLLAPGGIAAFECGARQGADVAAMMDAAGMLGVAIIADLAGHDRVVRGTAPTRTAGDAPAMVPDRRSTGREDRGAFSATSEPSA